MHVTFKVTHSLTDIIASNDVKQQAESGIMKCLVFVPANILQHATSVPGVCTDPIIGPPWYLHFVVVAAHVFLRNKYLVLLLDQ